MAITLKDKTGVSLKGTMTLPENPPSALDNLSMFKSVIEEITQRAAKKSATSGVEQYIKTSGIEPGEISPSTFGQIIQNVTKQKTRGIADIYTSTINLLDEQEKRKQELQKMQQEQAYQHLQLLSQNNALANLDDNSLRRLASQSGMDFDFLTAVRESNKISLSIEAKKLQPETKQYALEPIKVDGIPVGNFNPATGETSYIPAPQWFKSELEANNLASLSPQAVESAWNGYIGQKSGDIVKSPTELQYKAGVISGMPQTEADKKVQTYLNEQEAISTAKSSHPGYEEMYLSPQKMMNFAKDMVYGYRDENNAKIEGLDKSEAIKIVKQGYIRYGDEKIKLTEEQKNTLVSYIVSLSAKNTSTWSNLNPF